MYELNVLRVYSQSLQLMRCDYGSQWVLRLYNTHTHTISHSDGVLLPISKLGQLYTLSVEATHKHSLSLSHTQKLRVHVC
jgi:hypothetical protein